MARDIQGLLSRIGQLDLAYREFGNAFAELGTSLADLFAKWKRP